MEAKHKLKEEYFKVDDYEGKGKRELQKISINDPLKRSTDQCEYIFERIFPPETRNVTSIIYRDIEPNLSRIY